MKMMLSSVMTVEVAVGCLIIIGGILWVLWSIKECRSIPDYLSEQRTFDLELTEDNTIVLFTEGCCDGWYQCRLNKDDVHFLISKLIKLSSKMK